MKRDRDCRIRSAVSSQTAGFSLSELVITLGIAVVLATVALPGLVRLHGDWHLWSQARLLETSLQWGRMRAISANTPLLFEVWDDGRQYGWKDPNNGQLFTASARTMDGGVRIVATPRSPLRFYARGNAAPGGTYKVAGRTGSYSIIVTPGGRIRFQKN